MVKYRPVIPYGSTARAASQHKWYWKLNDYDKQHSSRYELDSLLRKRCPKIKSSINKHRLAQLLSRSERGLLSYDTCTPAELRGFCGQRRIYLDGEERKQDLIELLEDEDDNGTFDHFIDLPAELRNRIYLLHFQDLEDLKRPVPPPITKVSRQLRQETLLLFYQSCKLSIEFSAPEFDRSDVGHQYMRPHAMRPSTHAKAVFSRMPQKYLESIRKVRIVGIVLYEQHLWDRTCWLMDLNKKGFIHNGRPLSRGSRPSKEFDVARGKLEASLRTMVRGLKSCEGGKMLQNTDLERLRRIFEAAAEKHFAI